MLESSDAGRVAGADVLEKDVRSTQDGVCLLHHEDHPSFAPDK
ncbi:glycerophosphodiester phosphodiesterase family protein [Paenibacillus pinihumi]|nr:glycerophosphodiester phosphodiesterase family protein [Paenibacillus pinihumi]